MKLNSHSTCVNLQSWLRLVTEGFCALYDRWIFSKCASTFARNYFTVEENILLDDSWIKYWFQWFNLGRSFQKQKTWVTFNFSFCDIKIVWVVISEDVEVIKKIYDGAASHRIKEEFILIRPN